MRENRVENRQKIFDARFLHDRVAECRVPSAKITGFCRATFFVKDTFFSDHSKVEKKPREASEANAKIHSMLHIHYMLHATCLGTPLPSSTLLTPDTAQENVFVGS